MSPRVVAVPSPERPISAIPAARSSRPQQVREGAPMRNGGGAGLMTVRQVQATAARESNL